MISIDVIFQLCISLVLILIFRVLQAKQHRKPPGETSSKLEGFLNMQFGHQFKAIQFLSMSFQTKPCSTSWTSKLCPVVSLRDVLQGLVVVSLQLPPAGLSTAQRRGGCSVGAAVFLNSRKAHFIHRYMQVKLERRCYPTSSMSVKIQLELLEQLLEELGHLPFGNSNCQNYQKNYDIYHLGEQGSLSLWFLH